MRKTRFWKPIFGDFVADFVTNCGKIFCLPKILGDIRGGGGGGEGDGRGGRGEEEEEEAKKEEEIFEEMEA